MTLPSDSADFDVGTYNLETALMNSGKSQEEANKAIQEMREAVFDGDDPEDVLYSYGLEPDYVFDLIM